ncbi:DDHD domain-containing protein [Scheffersomyces coipomensis]|uniref:DDHD domain-containing protein n=1 Tax=Scheffersomyces coipomensis TaxID=1788519 RepID=UPI00315DA465
MILIRNFCFRNSRLWSIGSTFKVNRWNYTRSFASSGIIAKSNDTPPNARVKWYYATDVPISKPEYFNYKQEKDPEKFIPFSDYDSSKLENQYQKLLKTKSEQSESVAVNEDKLFEVDLKGFTLQPVYWEGPVFEVRRGTWFGTNGIPLPMKVSMLIEQAYRDIKPYNFEKHETEKPTKDIINEFNKLKDGISEDFGTTVNVSQEKDMVDLENGQWALFYDEREAVMFPSEINSKYQIEILRKFGPGPISLMQVNPIKRGYTDELGENIFDKLSSNVPSLSDSFQSDFSAIFQKSETTVEKKEKKERKGQLETDYEHDTSQISSNREIDHLILCIHGIGQVLGAKYESVNFTHGVNVFRNTMKSVFQSDKSYQELAYPNDAKIDESNTRIQVLPISWRHKIDFHPEKPFKAYADEGEQRLPTLSQLNVDGVKSLRNMIGDVAIDILLYYEPHYVKQIFEVVTSELNRVYKLYKEKNPKFNGKIHVLAHSLGSAIAFDLVSQQSATLDGDIDLSHELDFEIENLFCVGCPAGMFKLLEQKNIVARSSFNGDDKRYSSPKCANLYNIFHPCDPVGYRLEPLVSPKYANFKPEQVPFAVKGLNSQIKELANISDGITEKISKASSWFTSKSSQKGNPQSVEEKIAKENALMDIMTSVSFGDKKSSNDPNKQKPQKVELSGESLKPLVELNRSGRIDYSLPMGVFDFSLVSAVSAHISYFEDQDTAGFILKEVLATDKKPIESKVFTTVT